MNTPCLPPGAGRGPEACGAAPRYGGHRSAVWSGRIQVVWWLSSCWLRRRCVRRWPVAC